MTDIKRNCKDCGKEFIITEDNQKWFKENALHLPVRCEDCRKQRKAKRNGGK